MWCAWAFPPTTRRDCAGQWARFHVWTSLIPKPMTTVIGLGMRLDVRMHTRLENGVFRNWQQPGSAENNFFDHSKFEAMKLLSGWEAVRSNEDQFRTKIKVSTWAILSYCRLASSLNKEERIRKMAHLLLPTFAFRYLLCGFWATVSVLLITKALKKEGLTF